MTMTEPSETTPPMLRVKSGDPTPEELAAVVAVLAARRVGAAEPPVGHDHARSAWQDRSRLVRSMPWPAPGAWRFSARP